MARPGRTQPGRGVKVKKKSWGRVAEKDVWTGRSRSSVLSRFEIDSPFSSLSPVCLPGQFPASFSFRHGLLLALAALPVQGDQGFTLQFFFAFRYQYVLVVLLILSPIETGWRLGWTPQNTIDRGKSCKSLQRPHNYRFPVDAKDSPHISLIYIVLIIAD